MSRQLCCHGGETELESPASPFGLRYGEDKCVPKQSLGTRMRKGLQSHHLAHILHWRTAERNDRVVVFFQVELCAIVRLRLFAQREMLGHADEIGRELRR